jgi:hypothetical protein
MKCASTVGGQGNANQIYTWEKIRWQSGRDVCCRILPWRVPSSLETWTGVDRLGRGGASAHGSLPCLWREARLPWARQRECPGATVRLPGCGLGRSCWRGGRLVHAGAFESPIFPTLQTLSTELGSWGTPELWFPSHQFYLWPHTNMYIPTHSLHILCLY